MLTIQNLSFKHKKHTLFENLNFQITAGELFQISGANGSGKTTLLRVLANLLNPCLGDIFYKNQSIYENPTHYQVSVAYLAHTSAIKPGLTVRENLLSHAVLMGTKKPKLDGLLEKLMLLPLVNTFAYQLSQGQQRRVALAKVILSQRPIWILDEPLNALDDQGNCAFNALLTEHLHAKGIAVVATHQRFNINTASIKHLLLE